MWALSIEWTKILVWISGNFQEGIPNKFPTISIRNFRSRISGILLWIVLNWEIHQLLDFSETFHDKYLPIGHHFEMLNCWLRGVLCFIGKFIFKEMKHRERLSRGIVLNWRQKATEVEKWRCFVLSTRNYPPRIYFELNVNSKAREWCCDSNRDSDKHTGMADDFPKTLSKTACVPKTHLQNENFA